MLVAVSNDPADKRDELVDKYGLTFSVLSDGDLSISESFGVRQEGKDVPLPATFVMGEDRKVLFAKVGDEIPDRPTLEQILAPLRK